MKSKVKPWTLSKSGLKVTAEAHPHEVENAISAAQAHFEGKQEAKHRNSILRTALASVADGCTRRPQYMNCMRQKYGSDLVEKHHPALIRLIRDDMKAKGTYYLEESSRGTQRIDPHTETAAHKGKWFAKEDKAQQEHLWLNLPPLDREEPLFKDEDVREYQKGIKHLDAYQLSSGEYIKQAHRQMEEAPGRWHRKVPRKAMDRDLRSKNIDEDMFAHFQQAYHTAAKNVSVVLENVADSAGKALTKTSRPAPAIFIASAALPKYSQPLPPIATRPPNVAQPGPFLLSCTEATFPCVSSVPGALLDARRPVLECAFDSQDVNNEEAI